MSQRTSDGTVWEQLVCGIVLLGLGAALSRAAHSAKGEFSMSKNEAKRFIYSMRIKEWNEGLTRTERCDIKEAKYALTEREVAEVLDSAEAGMRGRVPGCTIVGSTAMERSTIEWAGLT